MSNPFNPLNTSVAADARTESMKQWNAYKQSNVANVWDPEIKSKLLSAADVNQWNQIMTQWETIVGTQKSKQAGMLEADKRAYMQPGRKGTILTPGQSDLMSTASGFGANFGDIFKEQK